MTCYHTEVELLTAVQPDNFLFLPCPWSCEPYKEVCFRCRCIVQHNKLRALFHSAYYHAYNGVLCLRSAWADQMMALLHHTYSHAHDSALCLRIVQTDQQMALLSCTYSHADGSVLCLRSVRGDAVMALFHCTYSHAYGRVLCLRFAWADQLMALFGCTYSHAYNSVLFLRSAWADQPGQHVLHELHPAVADPHSHPARLLPFRPAPLSHDRQPSAVPRLRDGPSLPGGEGFQHWQKTSGLGSLVPSRCSVCCLELD